MHPLLMPVKRLGFYVLAWIPLAAILIYLMAVPGKLGWPDAGVLVAPLCVVFALVCLSAWYSCKATPVQRTTIPRLALTHLAAAGILSLLWVQLARLLAYFLSRSIYFQGLDERFAGQVPVLFGAGFLFYLLAVAFNYVLLALEESRLAQARVMETSILAREAELKALKAQVNPHFLFNSLNSISALTSTDAGKAREMCILLADFLRMTLGLGEKSAIPLSEELSLLHAYLSIEAVRFGSRLQFKEEVDDATRNVLLPPLLLQPLIENAVNHGVARSLEGGSVRLSARNFDGRLSVVIENTFDSESAPARKGGLGLSNVRRRLEARYGSEATMNVRADEDRFRVELSWPTETSEARA